MFEKYSILCVTPNLLNRKFDQDPFSKRKKLNKQFMFGLASVLTFVSFVEKIYFFEVTCIKKKTPLFDFYNRVKTLNIATCHELLCAVKSLW